VDRVLGRIEHGRLHALLVATPTSHLSPRPAEQQGERAPDGVAAQHPLERSRK
jgi:hypothetical protein